MYLQKRVALMWPLILSIVLFTTACGTSDDEPNIQIGPSNACAAPTGLRAPLPSCSPEAPCTRVASTLGVQLLETSEVIPACDTTYWDERLTQTIMGESRHACIHRPSGTLPTSKRPLLVWFHGGGEGNADMAATVTQLINKADNFDLSGDTNAPGFILLSIQGRNLRYPTAAPRDGHHHDFYYRDLNSPSSNPDIENTDSFIDSIVQEGIVDTRRIYVMGWSNGAFFSQMYAIARNSTPTANGNKVASAAVFSSANPFSDISWDVFDNEPLDSNDSSCELQSLPTSTVPIQMVYRSSDAAVACNTAQAICFQTEPGYDTELWISDANNAGIPVQGLRIGGLESGVTQDSLATSCSNFMNNCPAIDCTNNASGDGCLSLVNHLRWPDGIYNSASSNIDWEIDMLQFLKNHPLPL